MISWVISVAYFYPLAKEYHGEIPHIFHEGVTDYMRVWAEENGCEYHAPQVMLCSAEDFVMFKLKGCVLRKLRPSKAVL